MPPDLVCFYADLGRPYLPLIQEMTASAKRVMPESRRIIITPTPSKALVRNFDLLVHVKSEVTLLNLCMMKVRSIVTWQDRSDRPCAYIDPDLVFQRPIRFPKSDVGLLWRNTKPSQPVNAGMILAKPGHADFWARYGQTAAGLPSALHGWWCDQLALSMMIGNGQRAGTQVETCGAVVELISEAVACAPPERATEETWALHLKGRRKGPGWEGIYPSAAGMSLPASA